MKNATNRVYAVLRHSVPWRCSFSSGTALEFMQGTAMRAVAQTERYSVHWIQTAATRHETLLGANGLRGLTGQRTDSGGIKKNRWHNLHTVCLYAMKKKSQQPQSENSKKNLEHTYSTNNRYLSQL